ncbi:IclR family transcriptional regulator C-terminal domain-containing protein [Streptomyces sp. NPDC005780]|uniref:IclR family transcriptional regulator domain-containing protein n=1 Tax=Streptomyces sp. NPDC005780 TaxID=3364730 RepID=UPI0036BA1072
MRTPTQYGITATVHGPSGSVAAALSVTALEHRVPDRRFADVVTSVRRAAESIGDQPARVGD